MGPLLSPPPDRLGKEQINPNGLGSVLVSEFNKSSLFTLQRLHTHVHLFRLYFHSRATSDANREHRDLIAAIEDGDADRAENALRHHIACSKMRFEDAFI